MFEIYKKAIQQLMHFSAQISWLSPATLKYMLFEL
jgi:hypothetical protein